MHAAGVMPFWSMKKFYILVLLALASAACKPDMRSKKGAERICSQICSNNVLGLTRIKEIQYKPGSTNAVVVYEHTKEGGGVEEQLLYLVYNGDWQVDSAKMARYTHEWMKQHPAP